MLPSSAAVLRYRDRKWTHFTPIHCMSLPVLAEIQIVHYAITRPWRGQSKPLYSMTWKIGHFDSGVRVCDSFITTATKASSTFTKFYFSGFCPNEALEKQRHWRVKHSTEANVATGECESGAYKQDWLAEGAAGVADWWVHCRQRWGDGKERVYTGVDCQQAEWQV